MTEPPPEPAAGGFLARLIERTSGRDGGVAPRLPSQYEPPTLQPTWAAEPLAGTILDGEDIEAFEGLAPSPTRPAGVGVPHWQRVQDPAPGTGTTAVPGGRRPSIDRPKTAELREGARSDDPAVPARAADRGEAATPVPFAAFPAHAADPNTAVTPLPIEIIPARTADPDAATTPPATAEVPGATVTPRLPPQTALPTIAHLPERRRSVDPAPRGAVPAASTSPIVRPVGGNHLSLSHPSAWAAAPSHRPRPADLPQTEAAGAHRSADQAQNSAVRFSGDQSASNIAAAPRADAAVVVEPAVTRVLSIEVPIEPPPAAPPPTAVVNISIGRIEVRAVPAASPPRAGRRDSGRPSPTLSLEGYLARRAGAQ